VASTSVVVACPNCGAKNRVRLDSALERQPVCGQCKQPLPAPAREPVTVTDSNYETTVASSHLPVLLDLWAAWCGPCRIIAPTIEALAGELAGKVLVGKLDVDANKRIAARFGVQGIPTLLIIKDGREVDRLVGVQSREAILNRLQPLI
jgi:thioredoxin 2